MNYFKITGCVRETRPLWKAGLVRQGGFGDMWLSIWLGYRVTCQLVASDSGSWLGIGLGLSCVHRVFTKPIVIIIRQRFINFHARSKRKCKELECQEPTSLAFEALMFSSSISFLISSYVFAFLKEKTLLYSNLLETTPLTTVTLITAHSIGSFSLR